MSLNFLLSKKQIRFLESQQMYKSSFYKSIPHTIDNVLENGKYGSREAETINNTSEYHFPTGKFRYMK